MLTLIRRLKSDPRKAVYRCDCGKLTTVWMSNAYTGHTVSCGCVRRRVTTERSTTHGHKSHGLRSKAYVAWTNMKARCANESNRDYKNYGGRGISFAPEWESFEVFFADMGEPPKGRTLDRRDNGHGYEKGNCRWATRSEQAVNRRSVTLYEYGGRVNTVAGWAREMGIKRLTLRHRLKAGWTLDRALTTKVG